MSGLLGSALLGALLLGSGPSDVVTPIDSPPIHVSAVSCEKPGVSGLRTNTPSVMNLEQH